MLRCLAKIGLLIGGNLLALIVCLSVASWHVERQSFGNWETESNMLIMPRQADVDVVLLGTSHARNFSRARNHLRLEEHLGQRVVNLSQGNGGGVVPMKLFLELFYARGNRADTVIYFIDPWVFCSASWNEEWDGFRQEPFSAPLLSHMITNRIAAGPTYRCLRSKLSSEWWQHAPESPEAITWTVEQRQEELVRKRLESLYLDGADRATFRHYQQKLFDIADLVQRHEGRLVLVLSPTLLGDEPARPWLQELAVQLEQQHGIAWYDFSNLYEDVSLFEDHDHLNTRGVDLFAATWLKRILDSQGESLASGVYRHDERPTRLSRSATRR